MRSTPLDEGIDRSLAELVRRSSIFSDHTLASRLHSIIAMSFELHRRKHLEDELTKIARRELGRTGKALSSDAGSVTEHTIHDARKSVKKVRAVATLMEEAGAKLPRRDRKRLKQAGRALSRVRDSAAIVESLDLVRRRYPRQFPEHLYRILHRHLVAARQCQEERATDDGIVAKAAKQLVKARRSARTWKSPAITTSDMVAVIADSYRRSRKAMRRSRSTKHPATLHEWRKQVKTLWYQLRLARPLTSGVAPLIADLKRLETYLGDGHNLVVLAATIRGCPDWRALRAEMRKVERLAARIRVPLQRRAFTLGRRVYARRPSAFARWVRTSSLKAQRRDAAAA